MGQWLVAGFSFFDIHFQLSTLLLTVIVLLWFLYVWATQ